MIKYPNGIDTDAELPRVDDNITEIGGEAINAVRAAVFAIEKALGVKPQGTAADLAGRLAVSLDSNGNIRASALSGIGLVTLPITNTQVGSAAGIEESKLDLDYGTALLKSWIDSLRVRVDALEAAVATAVAHLNQHAAGLWGRHSTGDVDAYGVFAGMTAQGALANLDTRLDAHIADPVAAHAGSAISLDASRFSTINATDVQSAAEQLEDLQLEEMVRHRDRQHGNGILGTQDAFLAGTRHGAVVIAASATTTASAGDTFVKFASAPSALAFQSIARNDRIDFTSAGGKTYTFVVSGTQSTNQVNIFGSMPVGGTGTATVYRTSEETSEPSVAVVCLRNDSISPRPSTLQVVHPSSPFVVGSGFRGSELSASARNIRLLYSHGLHGDTGDLDVYAAMAAFSAIRGTWTVENIARVMNSTLLSPVDTTGATKHPLVAFAYKGELAFAHDAPDADGYVEIGVPTANDATAVLGFVSGTSGQARAPRDLYIDGYEIPAIATLLDAYGQIVSSDTIGFSGLNLLGLGVRPGHLARVSPYQRGTYVIQSISPAGDQLSFDVSNELEFDTPNINKKIHVLVYADAFSLLSAPAQHTLYETFLDGYKDGYGPTAGFRASARVGYFDTPAAPGSALKDVLDVTAVSRSFGAASRRVFFDQSARTMVMGSRIAGPSISDLGPKVPMPPSNEEGFRFTLYDAYGVDYLEIQIASGLPGSDGYMDVSVYPRISEERFLQLATVLHNGSLFEHLGDTRQFGNVGRQDVRDDFTRDYVTYPRSLLRGNGVIYGFVASGEGTGTLAITGGQALVDGQLKSFGRTSFDMPPDGATLTYNLFMDREGTLRFLRDDYFTSGILSTPSTSELLSGRTETLLAKVDVNSSNSIVTITDLRRFVNDIDSKLDLLVEENDITHGSFASLRAATDYLNSLPASAACSRRIRVRGEVFLSETVRMPRNTELLGDGYGTGGTTNRSARITYLTSDAAIQGDDGLVVRDLAFFRNRGLANGFIHMVDAFSYLTVEGCSFEFGTMDATNAAMKFEDSLSNSRIRENVFRNAYIGIETQGALSHTGIEHNLFLEVKGNGILATGDVTESSIVGNTIYSSTLDTLLANTAFMRFDGNIARTKISDNIMVYAGSDASNVSRAMINMGSTLSLAEVAIERNVFETTNSGKGFWGALLIQPLVCTGLSVVGNWIHNFAVNIYETVNLKECSQLVFSGNMILGCARSLFIASSNHTVVANNIIQGGVGGVSDPHFELFDSCSEFTIVGNIVSADGTGFLAGTDTSCDNGMICGNFFEYTGTARGLLLDSRAPDTIIANNKFVAGTLTLYAPLRGGSNNLVIGNSLSITTPDSSDLIEFSGSGGTDVLNKGQTYQVLLSVAHATFDSDWLMSVGTTGNVIYVPGAVTSNKYAGLEFSSESVPVGAQIQSVVVKTNIDPPGVVTDLGAAWWSNNPIPPSSNIVVVSGPVNPAGIGSSIITLTPTPPYYMSQNIENIIITAGGTTLKAVACLLVTYKL